MNISAINNLGQQNYRSDIDGLRALAVLSVILFHINKKIIPGGFVGVDVFFVISGYLISLQLFRDLERGKFSISEFYRRRIKRIIPAMLVVVTCTLFLTQFLFLPEDAEATAESALWALFSVANIYFWLHQDTSYFAAASNQIPLLHLWSLGVEEQFYIFWPLVLMLCYRIASPAKSFFLVSLAVASVSFLLGDYLFDQYPLFVYYMLPTRAGELLFGALTAQVILKRNKKVISEWVAEFGGIIGLCLIVGSSIFLSEEKVFPGVRAVLPTLGTTMIILTGHYHTTYATRFLRIRPFVWVGQISYSAYLWHWPLLAFVNYSQPNVSYLTGISIFLSTMLLAWASYRFVEIPFRTSNRSASQIFLRQYILPVGALSILAIGSMKVDGYGLRWFSDDYKKTLLAVRATTKPAHQYDYVCQRQRISSSDLENKKCVIGNSPTPTALLWGDSNAAHFIGMLGVFAQQQGFSFRNIEVGSCPPIFTDITDFVTAKRLDDCRNSIESIRKIINNYSVIIISSSWSDYQSRSNKYLQAFFNTVQALKNDGKKVIILGQIPPISTYDRLCQEKSLSFPLMKCTITSIPLRDDVASINTQLKEFADNNPNIEYFDTAEYLCKKGLCSAFNNSGNPIYYDSSHLSLSGSWELGNEIYKYKGVPSPFLAIPRSPMNLSEMNY